MPRMTEETRRRKAERTERSAKRLNWILEKHFCGDRRLMAFVCEVSVGTINRWLGGRSLIQSMSAYALSDALPDVSYEFVMGRVCDDSTDREPQAWETVEVDHMRDVFNYRKRLIRELVGIQGNIKRYRKGDRWARYR